MKPQVSIIIPVYNVEKYLQQCLDSVLSQTYDNLEIVIVDDGSTDRSGNICDEYATFDERIAVFHTINKGLSAARNYGLDHCNGDYIAFIDSDDWMESETIELLTKAILSEDADIAVCGHFNEWKNYRNTQGIPESNDVSEGDAIIRDYLHGYGIGVEIWNKLYRSKLFVQIRFPEGRVFEDVATTYKLLDISDKLIRVPKPLIHYRMRNSSIGKEHSIKSLTDCWISRYERYEALIDRFEDCRIELLSSCVVAIGRFWVWFYGCAEKRSAESVIREMQAFVSEHKSEIIRGKGYSYVVRISCLLARYSSTCVFKMLYFVNQVVRCFDLKRMFE